MIGVLQEASGQGVGFKLLGEVEHWAREVGVKRLELTVMCHNERTIRLYKRAGFEIEGTKRKAIFMDQQMYDEYYMGKLLLKDTKDPKKS